MMEGGAVVSRQIMAITIRKNHEGWNSCPSVCLSVRKRKSVNLSVAR